MEYHRDSPYLLKSSQGIHLRVIGFPYSGIYYATDREIVMIADADEKRR